jgi:hypothetical protein
LEFEHYCLRFVQYWLWSLGELDGLARRLSKSRTLEIATPAAAAAFLMSVYVEHFHLLCYNTLSTKSANM